MWRKDQYEVKGIIYFFQILLRSMFMSIIFGKKEFFQLLDVITLEQNQNWKETLLAIYTLDIMEIKFETFDTWSACWKRPWLDKIYYREKSEELYLSAWKPMGGSKIFSLLLCLGMA